MKAVDPNFDVAKLVRHLISSEVEFLVVGGVAVTVHGFPRYTGDLDIVPARDPANLKRLSLALNGLEARMWQFEEFEPSELPEPDVETLLGGGNWCLATRHGRLDVLQFQEGVLETDEDVAQFFERAETAVVAGVGNVKVVGYADLVSMKSAAGREQDQMDIRALREARGE